MTKSRCWNAHRHSDRETCHRRTVLSIEDERRKLFYAARRGVSNGRCRQRERSNREKKKHTLLQLRSSTSASCPTNSLTGRVPKTGMTQTGARLRDMPFFLPLPVAAGTAGTVVVGVAGANVEAERPNEGTSCGKAESRGEVGLSVAARSCGLESTSQTADPSSQSGRGRSLS